MKAINEKNGREFRRGEAVISIMNGAATYVGCNAKSVFIEQGHDGAGNPCVRERSPDFIGAKIITGK